MQISILSLANGLRLLSDPPAPKPSHCAMPLEHVLPHAVLPIAERRQAGQALRKVVPRSLHASWKPPPGRSDPIRTLIDSDRHRWRICCRSATAACVPRHSRSCAARPRSWPPTSPRRRPAVCGRRPAATATWRISAPSPRPRARRCSTSTISTRRCRRRSNGTSSGWPPASPSMRAPANWRQDRAAPGAHRGACLPRAYGGPGAARPAGRLAIPHRCADVLDGIEDAELREREIKRLQLATEAGARGLSQADRASRGPVAHQREAAADLSRCPASATTPTSLSRAPRSSPTS